MSVLDTVDARSLNARYIASVAPQLEPILFLHDKAVGATAFVLVECFLWGFTLCNVPKFVKADDRERNHLLAELSVTSAKLFCERRSLAHLANDTRFLLRWHSALTTALAVLADVFAKEDQATGPMEWARDFLVATQADIPKKERHAAFPQTSAGGDALLCAACLEGITSIFSLIAEDIRQAQNGVPKVEGLDVFLSYHRPERQRVLLLANAIAEAGLSVWLDQSLQVGDEFASQIDRRLRAAKCVLVCWSPGAVSSRWVHAEALVGFDLGNLLPVVLAPCGIPAPFNAIQSEDLGNWSGDPTDTVIRRVISRAREMSDRTQKAD